MFKVVAEPTAWIDVEVQGLTEGAPDEPGQPVTHRIPMKVAFLPRDEVKAAFDTDSGMLVEDLVQKVARDWRVGDDGGAWPLDPAHIKKLALVVPNFTLGFTSSYLRAHAGQAKEREKNSVSSPDAGRATDTGARPSTTKATPRGASTPRPSRKR